LPLDWQAQAEAFINGTSVGFLSTRLVISNNPFTQQLWTLLCKFIARNGPVSELSVTNCDLNDSSVAELAVALQRNTCLSSVDLSFNKFSNSGAREILKAVTLISSNLNEIIIAGIELDSDLEHALLHAYTTRRKAAASQPPGAGANSLSASAPVGEKSDVRGLHSSFQALQRREGSLKKHVDELSEEVKELVIQSAAMKKSLRRLVEKEEKYKTLVASLRAETKELKKEVAAATKGAAQLPVPGKDDSKEGRHRSGQNMNLKSKAGNRIKLDLKNIVMGEVLDVGGSGAKIYYAYVDGWQCVCKELIDVGNNARTKAYFEKEISLLESLPHHKNIVRYLFHDVQGSKIRLFMMRYRSSLLYVLHERKRKADYFLPSEIQHLAFEIIKGLEFLHRNQIMHRDLKSDNIFVTLNDRKQIDQVAIGDFDCAKTISANSGAKTVLGTVGFMAPEVWKNSWNSAVDVYTYKADIFGYGMVLYEIMALHIPFWDKNDAEIANYMHEGVRPPLPDAIAKSPAYTPLVALFNLCTASDPSDRPDVGTVKAKLADMSL
jgi:regulator of replication initiation timing